MLLDTYGLVYAAYFAMKDRPLTTSAGMRIEAAYVFTTTLVKLLGDERPSHVVACFDHGLPAARLERYEAYKAQREAMPDPLREQFALVRRVLDAFEIPVAELEGHEADDVIATLAREAEALGAETVVVTGDNDLLQIVDDRTTVLVRTRMGGLTRYDRAAVRARFDLAPEQLADYRGLKGDPSDNLPGIPGVGEKTAIKLINAAGSLDALLANPALAGSPKLEALMREHAEEARCFRDVSRIVRDLEVAVPWEAARYRPPPPERLYPLYRELEFRSLLAKLPAPQNDALFAFADAEERLAGEYRSFDLERGESERDALLAELRAARAGVALAVAPSGAFGISRAAESGVAFSLEALGEPAVGEAFAEVLALGPPLAAHDGKALAAELRLRGLAPPGGLRLGDDTMIAAHLLNPSRTYAVLGDAAAEFLGARPLEGAAAAADASLRLAPLLRERLAAREQLELYLDVELPLVGILAAMEARGIAIDLGVLSELAGEVDAAIARLAAEIEDLAGEHFNIGSPQQLGKVLFEKLGLPSAGRTKTGYATGSEVLQPLAREHPIVAKVLEYREVSKLKGTYLDAIPRLLGADGRLRTIFNQTSTATGRISSTNPNLQNVPVRTELGRRIRRAFVAPPGRVLFAADYSQIELRIMAHLSEDAAMREAFARGEDIHDVTARGLFGVVAGVEVEREQRRIAKSVNFGLLYGMSDFGLAQRLEIERGEARLLTKGYFARFPHVREWIARNLEFGRERGYVETMLGRRRYMPDLRSSNRALRSAAEREATNAPMQGSAADLMKLAMVRVERALAARGLDAQMLLQIHDELLFEVAADALAEVAAVVRAEMERAYPLAVPLVVTAKAGPNWYEVEALDA
ncbi:MAG: DNA polymerase I [Vulcanimicrobiaceae bacterium]